MQFNFHSLLMATTTTKSAGSTGKGALLRQTTTVNNMLTVIDDDCGAAATTNYVLRIPGFNARTKQWLTPGKSPKRRRDVRSFAPCDDDDDGGLCGENKQQASTGWVAAWLGKTNNRISG